MTICINDDILLDENIKSQHLYTFLHLVKIAEEDTAIFTLDELMKLVKCKDRETVVKYLNVLLDNGYIEKLEPTNRKSTYKLNRQFFYK